MEFKIIDWFFLFIISYSVQIYSCALNCWYYDGDPLDDIKELFKDWFNLIILVIGTAFITIVVDNFHGIVNFILQFLNK